MRQSNSKTGRRIVEHHVRTPLGGRTFKVTLSCVADQHQEGQPSGVVAVLHDMTKEKEVAEMKNDFVSSVSHELRTPLASIKAYVEMLIDGEAEKDRKSTRLNSSHVKISYAVFCLKKKNKQMTDAETN